MSVAKGCSRIILLLLILVLANVGGGVTQAAAPAPPPPAGTAVQVQTYGVLPVMVMNLTQVPINFNISTNQAAAYTKANTPIAIGLSGVAYPQGGGATPLFSNPTTPTTAPSGATNASLQPAVSASGAASNTNFSFLNAFAMFPSWSGTVNFPNTAYAPYTYATGGASMGGTPGSQQTGDYYNYATQMGYGQSMAAASTSSINLNPVSSNSTPLAGYVININSLGGATSAYQAQQSSFPPQQDWVEDILTLLVDIETIAEPTPIGIADMVYGIYKSIKEMLDSGSESYTNAPYPATYKGINVTAAVAASGLTLPLTSGNSSYLVYETNAAGQGGTPALEQQNAIIVYTWRTSPQNTSTNERNSADTLVVMVVNQGVYAAAQMQQSLNNTAPNQVGGAKLQYKPSREQAQDSFKLLAILEEISKKNPQDAKKLIDTFGMRGLAGKAKQDMTAQAAIKNTLKEVFEKHRSEIPAIEHYLAKFPR
jgi:hypothetical protein